MSAKRFAVDLSNQAAYPALASPQVDAPFEPLVAVLKLETGDGFTVSFDGSEDHYVMAAGDPPLVIPGIKFRQMWFKAAQASTASVLLLN